MDSTDSSIWEVDTRGNCLACFEKLNKSNFRREEVNNSNSKQVSMKLLLRHLKIGWHELAQVPPAILANFESYDWDLMVTLCNRCGELMARFYRQCQNVTKARCGELEVDAVLEEMVKVMKEGDELRAREFWGRMCSPKGDLIKESVNITIAENLRKETIRKCSDILQRTPPSPGKHIPNQIRGRKLIRNASSSPTIPGQSRIKNFDQKNYSDSESVSFIFPNSILTSEKAPVEEVESLPSSPPLSTRFQAHSSIFPPTPPNTSTNPSPELPFRRAEGEIAEPVSPTSPHTKSFQTIPPPDEMMMRKLSITKSSKSILLQKIGHGQEKQLSPNKNASWCFCTHVQEFANTPQSLEDIEMRKANNLVEVEAKVKRKAEEELTLVTLGNEEESTPPHKKFKPQNSKLHEFTVNSKPEPLNCSFCERKFDNSDTLHMHHLTWHSIQVLKDELPLGTTAIELESVIEGILGKLRVSSEVGTKRCPYCEEKRKTYLFIRIHVLNSHLKEVIKVLEKRREIQGERERRNLTLNINSSVELSDNFKEIYKCAECGTQFDSTQALLIDEHERSHSHLTFPSATGERKEIGGESRGDKVEDEVNSNSSDEREMENGFGPRL